MNNFDFFEYNGHAIGRDKDGFFSLTQMCDANNVRLDSFMRLKSAKAYVAELERVLSSSHRSVGGVSESEVGVLKTLPGSRSGTWGHPLLAVELARWISVSFSVWCNAHIFNLMSTGSTSLEIDPVDEVQNKLALIKAETELVLAKVQLVEKSQQSNSVQSEVHSPGLNCSKTCDRSDHLYKRELCYRYRLFNGGGAPDYRLLNRILRDSGLMRDERVWTISPENCQVRVFDRNYLPELDQVMKEYLSPNQWQKAQVA